MIGLKLIIIGVILYKFALLALWVEISQIKKELLNKMTVSQANKFARSTFLRSLCYRKIEVEEGNKYMLNISKIDLRLKFEATFLHFGLLVIFFGIYIIFGGPTF